MGKKDKREQIMDYILQKINNVISEQKIKPDIPANYVRLLQDILTNRYTNGPDMNLATCLFDKLITSTTSRDRGVYRLSTPVFDWVKKMNRIDVKSSESTVYTSSSIIDNVPMIIKTPKNESQYNDLIREYYVGKEINKLRCIVPNFMYTLGLFMHDKDVAVMYEKIPGDSLEHHLKDNLTFDDFLNIFIQILIALEVGQKNIRFCHFDLHSGNIILRKLTDPFTYTVVLGNKRYDVTAINYMPIIIDFGMSTVTDGESKTVGSYYFSRYGMMNYMISGADMYKLLFYSSLHSVKNSSHRDILDLFTFYGKDDPYKFLIQNPGFLKKVSFEFAMKGAMSKSGTYTPLNFLKWIVNNSNYENVSSMCRISNRNIFFPLNYSNIIQQNNDLLTGVDKGREKVLNMCKTGNTSSYVMIQYAREMLNMYNKVYSVSFKNKLKGVSRSIKKSRRKLLNGDKKILSGYSNIQVPNKMKLYDYMNRILNIKLGYKKNINGVINKFLSIIKVQQKINPYLNFLYTIKELNLDKKYKIYRDFVTMFMASEQYSFHDEMDDKIEQVIRWCITLLESGKT